MPQEINRVTSVRRITSPDDSTTYVDLKIIDQITFIDPSSRGQETTFIFDNTDQSSRVATVFKLTGTDGDSTLSIERISGVNVLDKADHAQLTSFAIDNTDDPPVHLTTHLVKVKNVANPGIWLQVQRIDSIAFIDPADKGQKTIYTLNNLDDDTNLDKPTTTWDGSTINPPWRIDPFQNIVDVCWGTAIKLPAGSYVQTPSWLPANCYQMTFSFWFKQDSIASNAAVFAALEAFIGDLAEAAFIWNNALFASAPDFLQNTNGVVIGANVTGGGSGSDFGVMASSGFKQWSNIQSDPEQNRPNGNGYNAGDIADWLIFRSTPGVAAAGKWHHALVSFDTNGGGPADPAAPRGFAGGGGSATTATTKRCVLFIDGVNALDVTTIDDGVYFGDKESDSFPWRSIMQGKQVGVPITDPAPIISPPPLTDRQGNLTISYSSEMWTGYAPPSSPTVSFFQYQVWTNLFLDPVAAPAIMDFFIDTVTNDGVTTISPAQLDTAAKASYKAQGLPEKQWLSKAAAPCYYGKPALYLSGGENTFVKNQGSGGTVTLYGHAVSTGGPTSVPKRGS